MMVRLPTGRAAVEVCALPETTVTALPMGVEPVSNCTVPLATEGLMVAVSVSVVPENSGLAGEAPNPADRLLGQAQRRKIDRLLDQARVGPGSRPD